jgi:hypothetical protein
VGEVGYVGQVKRALGYRIPPEGDEVDGLAREKLDLLDEELRRTNRSRRDEESVDYCGRATGTKTGD